MASVEIHSIQTVSGNQARIRRIIEEAGQVFLAGVPVAIAADGGIAEKSSASDTVKFAGFSKDFGNNLAALGVLPTAAVNPTPQPSFGSVPFESSAVNITRPFFRDGRIGFEVAAQDTVFLGQVGPAQTAVATDVGVAYGLTKDTDNHWFVDKTKSTSGTNTYVIIVKLDPNDQSATPRGVYFVVQPATVQIVA